MNTSVGHHTLPVDYPVIDLSSSDFFSDSDCENSSDHPARKRQRTLSPSEGHQLGRRWHSSSGVYYCTKVDWTKQSLLHPDEVKRHYEHVATKPKAIDDYDHFLEFLLTSDFFMECFPRLTPFSNKYHGQFDRGGQLRQDVAWMYSTTKKLRRWWRQWISGYLGHKSSITAGIFFYRHINMMPDYKELPMVRWHNYKSEMDKLKRRYAEDRESHKNKPDRLKRLRKDFHEDMDMVSEKYEKQMEKRQRMDDRQRKLRKTLNRELMCLVRSFRQHYSAKPDVQPNFIKLKLTYEPEFK